MRVINFSTPNTLEELVQEIGRAGRNGENTQAMETKPPSLQNTWGKQKHLLYSRSFLFKDFLFYGNYTNTTACKWCDLYTLICKCNNCNK